MEKQTVLQCGGLAPDLFIYIHIDGSYIKKRVSEITSDAVVTEYWGAGTSAYKPLLASYGGLSKWKSSIAEHCGHRSFSHTCLTMWSAGGQVAKDICKSDEWPDAMVLLDCIYGTKVPNAKPGDGQVLFDDGLEAIAKYALSAANGDHTLVVVYSNISTPYGSTKECCTAIRSWVEKKLGYELVKDSVIIFDKEHQTKNYWYYGNLHIIEFAGTDAKEHILDAHLYDEIWRKWIPWCGQDTIPAPPAVPTEFTRPQSPKAETLKLGSHGPEVRRWQNFLLGQHCYLGTSDGIFGTHTLLGTKEFQRRSQLTIDGIAGPETQHAAMLLGYDKDASVPPPSARAQPFPSLSAVQREILFGRYKYEAAPTDTNPEAIKILDSWATTNIVVVTVPQLVGIAGAPSTGKVMIHRRASTQFMKLWRAWEQDGLLPNILTWGGSYAPRFVRGSRTTLSPHAWGTAFDINAQWNALGATPPLDGRGSVMKLLPLAYEHGFGWGGNFKTRPDGMHFQCDKLIE